MAIKLRDLANDVKKFASKKRKGKNLDPDSVKKVLRKLEKKQERVSKEHDQEISSDDASKKEIKRLELQLKVIKAQMAKARGILKDLG